MTRPLASRSLLRSTPETTFDQRLARVLAQMALVLLRDNDQAAERNPAAREEA